MEISKTFGLGSLKPTNEPLFRALHKSVVKLFRLIKKSDTTITVNIYYQKSGSSNYYLIPRNFSFDTECYMVDIISDGQEIVLEPGDSLYGSATNSDVVDYIITGKEEIT